MEISTLMNLLISKSKQALLLWLEGFREACCLHRVVVLCHRSRKLTVRTGQCFLLNGFIFLGSIFVLYSVVTPTLLWILPDNCSKFSSQELCSHGGIIKLYSFLRLALIQLLYVFWFYPLYVFSIILSTMWYNDIAKYGFAAMGRSMQTVPEPSRQKETSQNADQKDRSIDLGGIMIGIGEQVYSVLLLSFFFLEVYATGFIPYIGKAINFLLLAWLYAYYCFEYKWNFSEVGLDKRLDFFESNWAFFAGFGSPCVLAIFFFSPLVSYGVMAILFPLFVLTATGSRAEDYISLRRREWKGAGLGRLPIFYAADTLSLRILSFFHFHLECGKLKQEGTLSKKLS
ncbi:protein EI24 homolog isoform X1 [Mangifera indica]|uniref:protein EI24 homolog isoform X1 n=1 Tax=Mangifera indica TaxID=29780 RepID=UPI001CFC320E|nr:protein EI24 homolog isoform X1 [Mangifera indica]